MPPARGILFVNKTPASKLLSRSDEQEKSKIFSHVQKGVPRGSRSFNDHSTNSSGRVDPTDAAEIALLKAVVVYQQDGRDLAQSLEWPAFLNRTRKRFLYLLSRPPSPLNNARFSEKDYFTVDPAVISGYIDILLSFYNSTEAVKIFPIKFLAIENRHQTLLLAERDPILVCSLLYITSAAMHATSGCKSHVSSALYFKDQTLRTLQVALTRSAVTGSGLYAISLLLWVECLLGELNDAQAHLSGLQGLLRQEDVLDDCPPAIRRLIYEFSLLCAAMLRVAPAPLLTKWDLDSDLLQTLGIHAGRSLATSCNSAASFHQPWAAEALGDRLLYLIGPQQQCILFEQRYSNFSESPPCNSTSSVYAQRVAVEYALLSLPFESRDSPLTAVQESVRIALFITMQPLVMLLHSESAVTRAMAMQLKTALEATDSESVWAPNASLFLWVAFIGCFITDGQGAWSWFVNHFSSASRFLSLDSFKKAKEVLVGFFYLEADFDRVLSRIIESA